MPNTPPDCWILIRGLGREAAHWGEFVDQLQTAFPNSQIICPDLPGTGKALDQTSPWTIADITDTLRHQIKQTAIDLDRQRCGIVGLSLGGMVTWDWLKRYPKDASLGVLINTSFADLSPFYHRLYWKRYGKMLQLGLTPNRIAREKAIIEMVCNAHAHDRILQHWSNIAQQRPVSAATLFRQLVAAARFRAGDKPQQTTLILSSAADNLVNPRCSQRLHQHYGLPINIHPWAGHDLSTDDPAWVAARLSEFCQSKAFVS